MSVSGVSGSQPSYRSPASIEVERTVLVLKKQQESAKAQAQALVDLIADASASGVGRRLDVYA